MQAPELKCSLKKTINIKFEIRDFLGLFSRNERNVLTFQKTIDK